MERNVVNWFEIPVEDMDRSKKFYEAVFKTELQIMNMPETEMAAFPWVQGATNAAGSLVKSAQSKPGAEGSMVYFECDDVSDELSRIESNGGKILVPKTSLGEFGFMGQFMDTEGNKVGLHSQN